MNININYLKEFIVLSRCSRLADAAKELYVSPSTLSSHITSLENDLGCVLFDRERGMALTAKGDLALEHAQRILIEYETMKRVCSDSEESIVELRTPNYYMGTEPLLAVRDNFIRTHPKCRVVIKSNDLQMANPLQVLENGLADITRMYVVRESGDRIETLLPPNVKHIYIGSIELILLSTPGHPLARKDTIDLHDLDGQTFITSLSTLSMATIDGVRKKLSAQGVETNVLYRHVNDHSDVFSIDAIDCISLAFETKTNEYPIDTIPHKLSFDLYADIYLLYMPKRLNKLQCAYLEAIQRAAKQHPLLS